MTDQTAFVVGIAVVIILVLHNLPALLIGGAIAGGLTWLERGSGPS